MSFVALGSAKDCVYIFYYSCICSLNLRSIDSISSNKFNDIYSDLVNVP